ncbi:hypothetical protein V6Z11_A05G275500 [Gossypium hirsutum]
MKITIVYLPLITRNLDGKVLATPEIPYMYEVSHDLCIPHRDT